MSSDQRETGRLEAFSDGVFAFAITPLVLNLRDPTLDTLNQKSLLDGLVAQWPSLLGMVTSFATILIMWVNHHSMFTRIRRIDTALLFLNGLLLFFVVLQPFTTLLVANHVSLAQTTDGETAAAAYSGACLLLGLVWTVTGWYSTQSRLIVGVRPQYRYFVGPTSYAAAFGLSFVYALASVVVILAVAAFFAAYARSFMRRDEEAIDQ